ncbi:hypothetical protein AB395_0000474 [Sinorhizobium fredii CCBAU 45436]|nr:hypothetical protein AB395_0000474 [Sinorhizobium fredii CCBAU 45436]
MPRRSGPLSERGSSCLADVLILAMLNSCSLGVTAPRVPGARTAAEFQRLVCFSRLWRR